MTGATLDFTNLDAGSQDADRLTDMKFRANVLTLSTGLTDVAVSDSQKFTVNLLEENGIVTVFVHAVCSNLAQRANIVGSLLKVTTTFND